MIINNNNIIYFHERMLKEKELTLVHRGVEAEMNEINAGKTRTYSFDEIKKTLGK